MIKPSQVPVHDDSWPWMLFTATFGKAEAEVLGVCIVRALAKHGDDFNQALTLEELWPFIEECDVVRAGIIDPTVGRQVLLEDGHVTIAGEPPKLCVTATFVERVRKFVRQPS